MLILGINIGQSLFYISFKKLDNRLLVFEKSQIYFRLFSIMSFLGIQIPYFGETVILHFRFLSRILFCLPLIAVYNLSYFRVY